MLREYFGEAEAQRCGTCDVCLERNDLGLSRYEFDDINSHLKSLLTEKSHALQDVILHVPFAEEKTLKVIRWLLDHEKIAYDEQNYLLWKSKKTK